MKYSFRKFLLLNLFLTLLMSTLLIGIGNYYLDQKDIHDHLDALMVSTGLVYVSLLSSDITKQDWQQMQRSFLLIPTKLEHFDGDLKKSLPLWKVNVQIIDKQGHVRLRSPLTGPIIPAPQQVGLSDVLLGTDKWRVFSAVEAVSGLRVVLAERYESRSHLGKLIAIDDLYMLLFAFPLSGLLIWFIVGRGLNSLAGVAKEIANRAPKHLAPVVIKDVPDEIRPLVQALNHLLARLKAGFDREKRFAADAAHELKTPLAALKAQAQLALAASSLHDKNAVLEKLVLTLDRSARTVQQLLTMNQLASDSYTSTQLANVNFIQVVQDVLAMLIQQADQKKIEISFDYKASTLLIPGNSTALAILVRNLVENAISYSFEHGVVQVRAYRENKHVILEIEDNGPGIPEQLRSRVFERFYRVLGSQTPGSGLGLGIVHQICELHDAKVSLQQPVGGRGLVVQVVFHGL